MKIALLSDIHAEFHGDCPTINPDADLVILAGDIDSKGRTVVMARELQQKYSVPVIVVAGNHEHYGRELTSNIQDLRVQASRTEDIHFLENNTVVIAGVRFLGCTLWSDFALNGKDNIFHHMRKASNFIPDFSKIHYRGRRFTPQNACDLFQQSYAWLESELAQRFEGKTVVVTHFSPHSAAIDPSHLKRGADELTPYFSPDCSALISRYQPALWCYGHTHNSVDVVVESGTRLVSNQRGYPAENHRYTQFNPLKLVSL